MDNKSSPPQYYGKRTACEYSSEEELWWRAMGQSSWAVASISDLWMGLTASVLQHLCKRSSSGRISLGNSRLWWLRLCVRPLQRAWLLSLVGGAKIPLAVQPKKKKKSSSCESSFAIILPKHFGYFHFEWHTGNVVFPFLSLF